MVLQLSWIELGISKLQNVEVNLKNIPYPMYAGSDESAKAHIVEKEKLSLKIQSKSWKVTGLEFALDIGRIILEGDFEILIKAPKTGCGSLAQSGHIATDIHYLDCEQYIVPCFFVHKFMFFSYSIVIL